jgi:hypothetical protein
VKLAELEPTFVRYELQVDTWTRVLGDPGTYKDGDPTEEVTGPREHTILDVPFAEAQGIEFLCPKCFLSNGGAGGTHWCNVTFSDRGVADQLGAHNTAGKPTRWAVSGDRFENLTTTPSILLEGGCGWHGFITNGEIS